VEISSAPLRRRISRSLATILFLSLIQGVVAPVLAPQYLTPNAIAADANPFPSGISGVIRYVADSYTAGASTWSDINGANPIQIGGTAATKVVNSAGSLGASSSVTAVQGTFATTMLFPATVTADTNYTLFYIARYAPQQSGYTTTTSCTGTDPHTVSSADKRNRIFSSETGNWLSGFWACASGVAYHEGWLTQSTNAITELSGASGNNWLLGTDCGYTLASTSTCKGRYRAFGLDRTVAPSTDTVAHRIAINRGGFPTENTDFQIAEVIAVPTILQMNDVIKMETYLSRAYGIPLSAGASTKLGVYTASVGSTLGQTFTTQPQIAIQDSNSQTVTTDNTTIITATISGANGTLLGTRTATAIRGIATFDNLSVTGTAGTSYTITYTSNTSLTATSESRSFTRSSRTVTVALSKATAALGETAVATVATTPSSNSDGTVTFTVSSSTACTVNASTGIVTVSRPFGTCSVGATIGAGATYDTATATSVPLTISTPGNETDTALELNGTNQYAWVADTGTGGVFDLGTTMTLEAWVYPTETGSAVYIVATKVDSFQLFHIDGIWKYAFRPTATNFGSGLNTLVPVRINEWHHIAITRTGNSSSFYYDGQLAYTGTGDVAGANSLNDNSIPFVIGGKTYDGVAFSYPFQGSIDQVALYSVVRDVAGIDADMDSYISPSSSGLRAYYDFNEGSGSVLFNRASSATPNSDLAILGSPLWSDVKVVSNSSAHTTVKFPRTYITSVNGWRVPNGASIASALVVAGGGGGGSRVGGGTTIGINGETSVIRDINQAPTITGVTTSGDFTYPLAITGAGFSASGAGTTTIKFWRNQILGASDFIIKSDTLIWAKQPAGATVGKVLVINGNGTAVSEANFTPLVFSP
jgi:hypothetical protein